MKRSPSPLRASILPLLTLLAAGQAQADWTASGTFEYVDREYDATGFTGLQPSRPVRQADVEVVDANATASKAVIAKGATDLQGRFSILVRDSKVRAVYVRAITRSSQTTGLYIDVRKSGAGKAKHYAVATASLLGHGPSVNVFFGTVLIPIGQGGEAFNIYDQMLLGTDYLALLNGSRPGSGKSLAAAWAIDSGVGASSYAIGSRVITLRNTAGYDDTVILHEMGHFAVHEYSASHSPGGAHRFADCFVDLRLAFDEGFATYWGNSSIRHAGLPRSHIYMRSTGAPGPGGAELTGNLEADDQFFCQGSTGEVNVFSDLWDIADGPATTDDTIGVDDPHDLMDVDDTQVWEVMTGYLPGAVNISFEDLWDGWFLPPIGNGFRQEMIAIGDHLVIQYHEDASEVNDSAGQATTVATNGSPNHSTFFRDPDLNGAGAADTDYFSFSTTAQQTYTAETRNLRSDGNTFLEILDSDGQTVLASNNDRTPGDDSSRLDWTAPRADRFYVRVTHAADLGSYGSYDLVITATP
jgi:hypothetical protein